ncbi:ester cyclase [Prescottella agglutinans]|uniref:Steroid delta-isomerase-like uncharacterized protein n=1 Tax=Prescottella agglutinans TaxID=1644129 RepID=A0ABT6M754_9NOCA|nr:nuclear transport factor 2 family protein [Prescottella agglutinans]MDH6279734.1 steroid delta-isomerase-like uncharacterized protein [Prescottella agglutinans]
MDETTPARTIDAAWADEFADRWANAWNSHRAERVFEFLTDDIVWDDSAWPNTMRGKAAVREFLDNTWRAFPDQTLEAFGAAHVAADGRRAAFWWRGHATHLGPTAPSGIPATGKRLEFEGAEFHEYRDGKIARLRVVFDINDLAMQLGVVPKQGSMVQKMLVGMLKLRSRFRRS